MKNLEFLNTKDKNNLVTKKDKTLKSRVAEVIKWYVCCNKIYYSHYSGSGRYIRLVTYKDEILNLIKLLGYNYELGNDAPKGGKQGDFVKISTIAFKTIKSLIN